LETQKAETHLGFHALALAFFPKLLQGPIERAGHLLPQLRAKYNFNSENFQVGIFLIASGLFKKLVIADRLALYVDTVFANLHDFTGVSLLLTIYGYSIQIYMAFFRVYGYGAGQRSSFQHKPRQELQPALPGRFGC
jgi:D-alanyl-lipoteichoic acid acyltransferase DltB (MBOAT superfamily)